MTSIKETIRKINAGILNEDADAKAILFITFSEGIEQQTTIANLALMYGQAGENTMIIDTDFSRETFPTAFNLKSNYGLSDYLDNWRIPVKDIVLNPGDNVDLISSGKMDVNDTKYLVGDLRFESLVSTLKEDYDRILINARNMPDSKSLDNLLRLTDGVILVPVIGKTSKHEIYSVIRTVNKNGVKILGYVNAKR